jgi:hypothetical protein
MSTEKLGRYVGTFYLETGRARIPQIHPDIYSVPRIVVLNFRLKTNLQKIIPRKPLYQQMDEDTNS